MNALVTFEAAARLMSFTAAGQELNVVQPAITKQIRLLEENLRVKLFVRDNNSLSLTNEGKALKNIVSRTLTEIAHYSELVREEQNNSITIGTSFAFANLWLAERLPKLRRILGSTKIRLLIWDEYTESDNALVDFSVRFGNGEWPGMNAELLFIEDITPVASPSLIKKHNLEQNTDWKNIPLLDMEKKHEVPEWTTWKKWYEKEGKKFDQFNSIKYYENYIYILDAAIRSEGVALGSTQLADKYINEGTLVPVGKTLTRKSAGYYLVYHKDHFCSVGVAEVVSGLNTI